MKGLFQLKLIFIVLYLFAKHTDERARGESTYGDDDDDTLVKGLFPSIRLVFGVFHFN